MSSTVAAAKVEHTRALAQPDKSSTKAAAKPVGSSQAAAPGKTQVVTRSPRKHR